MDADVKPIKDPKSVEEALDQYWLDRRTNTPDYAGFEDWMSRCLDTVTSGAPLPLHSGVSPPSERQHRSRRAAMRLHLREPTAQIGSRYLRAGQGHPRVSLERCMFLFCSPCPQSQPSSKNRPMTGISLRLRRARSREKRTDFRGLSFVFRTHVQIAQVPARPEVAALHSELKLAHRSRAGVRCKSSVSE
jgi:hypothetical protein